MWQFVLVFVLGALTVVGVEAAAALYLLRWLTRKIRRQIGATKFSDELSYPANLDPSFYNKQGIVWVLDLENISRASPVDKASGQKKSKKEIVEVEPVQKYAKIKDHSLFLIESDGSDTEIQLRHCAIAAVSATALSSRKWSKRYPIQIESKSTSTIYKGSRTFYIFLETSWEKESWCKALRLASCEDKEKLKWFVKLNLEFQNYLTSLNAVYPSFMKPLGHVNSELIDKSMKFDGSSSKVVLFLKKLAKKTSKAGMESKAYWVSGSSQGASTLTSADCLNEEVVVPSSLSMSTGSSTQSHLPVISESDSDDKVCHDEGTLCWNLLLSRLFFDVKENEGMRYSMQARIQRALSNMRSPCYMGEMNCSAVNLGNLPPYIHGMRVLPSDMNEVCIMEIDVEYSGGAILEVETRIAVQDLDLEEKEGTSREASDVDAIKSDLLEGFEHFQKHMKSEETPDHLNHTDEDFRDEIRNNGNIPRASPQVSRWKAILHSIAKQVSQVPISLGIRVASLRGTIRLFIKSPPSDQIWFGFTSMPDLDFQLESFVGDHRITSGHIALFLINRFKAAIRETLVLPNCESVCLPWMLAEKEDWVPRKVAPFIWINKNSNNNNSNNNNQVVPSTEPEETKESNEATVNNREIGNISDPQEEGKHEPPPITDSFSSSSSAPKDQLTMNGNPMQEPPPPPQDGYPRKSSAENLMEGDSSPSGAMKATTDQELQQHVAEPKRIGSTKAKMLGLGKKMGEKFEEKRRHIEVKGRHIVEKMRGQQQQ
ncbi:unnamed protein product [Cuscuta campestris]|uniref:SMP-LTD domain-containing protein n=1 Tax=Cuscuta campestris TaxID=132261 RepID=A0A484MHF8_9ASTE|nr:unnamed protein product [Cuscuta campestris]